MGTQYFTLEHETLEILNEFPILKDVSTKNHFGLERAHTDGETLLQTLQSLKYSEDEIRHIFRRLNLEVDKFLSKE